MCVCVCVGVGEGGSFHLLSSFVSEPRCGLALFNLIGGVAGDWRMSSVGGLVCHALYRAMGAEAAGKDLCH